MSIEIDNRVLAYLAKRRGQWVTVREIALATHSFDFDVREALVSLEGQGLAERGGDKGRTTRTDV